MRNRGKTWTAAQNLAFRKRVTGKELATLAGPHFFPQATGTNIIERTTNTEMDELEGEAPEAECCTLYGGDVSLHAFLK